MAPQVGFEPTTDRLTADCSTTELLWNNMSFIKGLLLVSSKITKLYKKSCLATSYSHRGNAPTTIGAEKLNFCVRYGNRCDLLAIVTRHTVCYSVLSQNTHTCFLGFAPSKLNKSKQRIS
jgi:hypothetical protein